MDYIAFPKLAGSVSTDARGRILAGISDVINLLDLGPLDFNTVAATDHDLSQWAAQTLRIVSV